MSRGRDESSTVPAAALALPRGAVRLIVFQFWDFIAFYGSRLLLVLFLTDRLSHPKEAAGIWGLTSLHSWAVEHLGLSSDQAFVSAIFGLFGTLAFVTPVLGGWLSDRFISRRNAVIAGSLLMAAGHTMLALQAPSLIGLVLLASGNGFYRSTSGALLVNLFRRDDPRLPGAFQLSYTAGNLAAMATPLICGTLGELWGWSWGFGAAACAMLVGFATFLSIPAALLAGPNPTRPKADTGPVGATTSRLLLLAGVTLFMIGNEQLSNAVVVWLKTSVDRRVGTMTIPLTWFFSVSPLMVAAASLLLARRPPQDAIRIMQRRMVRGCLIGGSGLMLLSVLALADSVPAIQMVLVLLLWGTAFALVLPSGAGLMAELTPDDARGGWLGLYLVVTMIADLAVGALGSLYERMPHSTFIAFHAAIVLAGATPLAALSWKDRAR